MLGQRQPQFIDAHSLLPCRPIPCAKGYRESFCSLSPSVEKITCFAFFAVFARTFIPGERDTRKATVAVSRTRKIAAQSSFWQNAPRKSNNKPYEKDEVGSKAIQSKPPVEPEGCTAPIRSKYRLNPWKGHRKFAPHSISGSRSRAAAFLYIWKALDKRVVQ